jgi:hypothetical protein
MLQWRKTVEWEGRRSSGKIRMRRRESWSKKEDVGTRGRRRRRRRSDDEGRQLACRVLRMNHGSSDQMEVLKDLEREKLRTSQERHPEKKGNKGGRAFPTRSVKARSEVQASGTGFLSGTGRRGYLPALIQRRNETGRGAEKRSWSFDERRPSSLSSRLIDLLRR